MISKEAQRVEAALAALLREEPDAVRSYVVEVLEERLWRGGEDRSRATGFRFVRGSHGPSASATGRTSTTAPCGRPPSR
ncbi:MAG: hypothetical protein ABIR67_07940 [Gaiellaceae bacterium]